jgi:hypothetical protein
MVRSSLLNKFRRGSLLLFLLQATFFSFSQNLVPNPSFEVLENNSCFPGNSPNVSTLDYSVGWTSSINAGTADLFCTCKGNGSIFYINNNVAGSQIPRTDSTYTGIVVYDAFDTNKSEYIQIKLLDTLIEYQAYQVGFYISSSDNFKYELRNVGAYLGDTVIYSGVLSGILNYTPQIINDASHSLYNPTGWTLVMDTLYATGTEKHLVIGNFFDNAHSIVYQHSGSWGGGYYYIDDVFVIPIPGLTGIKKNKEKEPGIKLFPNPSNGEFTIEQPTNFGKNKQLQIFDISGKLVYTESLPSENNKHTIKLNELLNGVYFYKVSGAMNMEMKNGKIIIIK